MRPPPTPGALLALALAGCAAAPPATLPTVALAPAFRNATLQAPGPSARPVADRWWTRFDDPKLDRLVEEALGGSLDVEVAAARLQQAAAGVRAARAAGMPLVTAEGSAAEQRQSLEDPSARAASHFPGYERTSELYGLNLAVSWEIDLFGGLAAGRRAARADLQAAQAAVAGARLTVAAEIASAYLDVREIDARLTIAGERIATLGELDRLVRLRYARGVAARLEADQIAADLAFARAAPPALEAAREAAFNRIDLLAGRAPGFAQAELGAGAIPAAPDIASDAAPAALLLRRPDVAAAERTLAAADARAAQALADRYPKLNIAALAGLLSGGTSTLFTNAATQGTASAALSGPVLDFGRTGAAVDLRRAQAREAAAAYRATLLRAAGEAEDGFSDLARRKTQALSLEESVAALGRARDASRRAYRGGAVSLIEALDAERRLQASQDGAATARADAARAAVATYRALGGGDRAAL